MELTKLKKENDLLIAALTGRMDAVTADAFTTTINGWIDDGHKSFAIDCDGLDYISSAGLRALLMAAKKVSALKGSLKLAALQESVATVFKMSGFDKIIPIYENLEKIS